MISQVSGVLVKESKLVASDKRTYEVFDFDSWGDLLEYADKRESFYCGGGGGGVPASRREGYDRIEFTGTESWQQAYDLAVFGWKDGSVRAGKLSSALVERIGSLVERFHVHLEHVGIDFDMPLVLQGQPEHWYNFESTIEHGTGGIVRIVFNNTVSSGVSRDVLIARGAAVAALVELLEVAGKRVEVTLLSANGGQSRHNEKAYVWRTIVKQAGTPLDIDRLTYALAHPSAFRRVFFSVYEGHKEFIEANSWGYGRVIEAPKEMHGDIYIGSAFLYDTQWENPDSATKWILEKLREQGVKLNTPSES